MIKQSYYPRERIEAWLSQYREKRCKAEQLRLDIEALQDEACSDESIEAATFAGQRTTGMPRATTPSDVTGRLAAGMPDRLLLDEYGAELRVLERQIRRMDAWIAALPCRERRVVELFYVQGMTWVEVVYAYNTQAGDGGRSERALMDMKRSAIQRIERISNRNPTGIQHESNMYTGA